MMVIMYILSGVLLVALIALTAARPAHASVSLFELRRRKKTGNQPAKAALHREELLAQLGALKAPLSALILLALFFTYIHVFGRSGGVAAAVATAVLYGRIARVGLVRKFAAAQFRRYESKLLGFTDRYRPLLQVLSGKQAPRDVRWTPASREELFHVLESSDIFTSDDRTLLKHTLRFKDQKVKQLMVPRDKMVTVKSTELLGPLVLDDLHKTGHTIFPVTKGNDIVGLLDSSDHVALRTKESVDVRSVMYTDVTKIDQSAYLDEALQVFVETKQALLMVVDDDDRVVGLLGLGDVVRALTGWKQQ